MWVIRSRWLCARPQQLHSVSNGATAALRQAPEMVSSGNVTVQISTAISSPRHHNNNRKLYLNLDFTIYNPHLALIGYMVPILNLMLGGEGNLSHRKIQNLGQVGWGTQPVWAYETGHSTCNMPVAQVPQCTSFIIPEYHPATEVCTGVHISVIKRHNAGHVCNALWDLWDGSSILRLDRLSVYRGLNQCNTCNTKHMKPIITKFWLGEFIQASGIHFSFIKKSIAVTSWWAQWRLK